MKLLYLGPPETLIAVKENVKGVFDVNFATIDGDAEKALTDADAILDAYMKVRFPKSRLEAAKNLKLIVTATTGADHIDADYLASRNIPLLTLKGQKEFLKTITPAAEHSWLLLMACARRLRGAIKEVENGQWDRNKFPGIMLRGKTLGIVGCGRIGQWMATYATAFGMTCVGFDPHLTEWPATIRSVDLATLTSSADFVTVHVPLENETKNLIGAKEFGRMKKGVVIVNTSRGDVMDEAALLAALKSGTVGAVGLDVLMGEPNIDQHPLVVYARSNDNVIITPHIGGYAPETLLHVLKFSCQRITDHFKTLRHESRPETARRAT